MISISGVFERDIVLLGSLLILFLSFSIGGATNIENISIQRSNNDTSYEWIDRIVNQYLLNETEQDHSPVNLLLHPAADSEIMSRVVKACMEKRPSLIRRDEEHSMNSSLCNIEIACSKITRIIAVYDDIDDIKPRDWHKLYGKVWTPRSKIAIFISRVVNYENSLASVKLEEKLANFWSIDCLDVVLIVMTSRDGLIVNNGTLRIYNVSQQADNDIEPRFFGYDPFVMRKSNGYPYKRGRLLIRDSHEYLFPEKLKNLHGYPITMSVYHQEPHSILFNYTKLGKGTTIERIRYLAKYLNFTIDLNGAPIEASNYKVLLPDGSVVGPVGDILKNRSIILANTDWVNVAIGRKLEYIRPYDLIIIGIIVPRASQMPSIIRVFRSIDIYIALLIFSCFIILTIFFNLRKKSGPIMKAYRLFIHQHLEEPSYMMSERIFFIAWIIWAFIVCAIIQSNLMKDLTDPPFYKNIDSLDDLEKSSLILMADPIYLESLNNSDSKIAQNLAINAIAEYDLSVCMKKLISHGDVACAMDSGFIMAAARKLNDISWNGGKRVERDNRESRSNPGIAVHIVKEHLTQSWRTMMVKDGCPYLRKFNEAYYRFIEFGLYRKWHSDSTSKSYNHDVTMIQRYKLNMSHLEGTFKILFIGLIIGSIVFFCEIVFHRIKRFYGSSGITVRGQE